MVSFNHRHPTVKKNTDIIDILPATYRMTCCEKGRALGCGMVYVAERKIWKVVTDPWLSAGGRVVYARETDTTVICEDKD